MRKWNWLILDHHRSSTLTHHQQTASRSAPGRAVPCFRVQWTVRLASSQRAPLGKTFDDLMNSNGILLFSWILASHIFIFFNLKVSSVCIRPHCSTVGYTILKKFSIKMVCASPECQPVILVPFRRPSERCLSVGASAGQSVELNNKFHLFVPHFICLQNQHTCFWTTHRWRKTSTGIRFTSKLSLRQLSSRTAEDLSSHSLRNSFSG